MKQEQLNVEPQKEDPQTQIDQEVQASGGDINRKPYPMTPQRIINFYRWGGVAFYMPAEDDPLEVQALYNKTNQDPK